MTDTPKSPTKIIVNGEEVGPEKVPEMLRRFIVDADQNGVPDFLDRLFKSPLFKMMAGKSMEDLKRQLQNMKNLTPAQRQKIAQVMEKLGSKPSFSTPQIDYRSLGIPDPEQKNQPLGWIAVAILLAAIGAAAWMLMR